MQEKSTHNTYMDFVKLFEFGKILENGMTLLAIPEA